MDDKIGKIKKIKGIGNEIVPEYTDKHLAKINSMRKTASQPDVHTPPVLTKGQVLFVTAASRHNQPNSCYNCWLYNQAAETCSVLPQSIVVKKFVSSYEFKEIEYWPVCGAHLFGKPNMGPAIVREPNDPDYLGLCWINAPEVGQKYGGSNCGGSNGGDDCDHWQIPPGKDDKRKVKVAFCRVLQAPTACGDCCGAWDDDDILNWQDAQAKLKK